MLIELLEALGAEVDYYDPYVPEVLPTREHAALAGRHSIEWTVAKLKDYDAALICTDHDGIDYDELVAISQLIIDTRNATNSVSKGQEKVVKA